MPARYEPVPITILTLCPQIAPLSTPLLVPPLCSLDVARFSMSDSLTVRQIDMVQETNSRALQSPVVGVLSVHLNLCQCARPGSLHTDRRSV